MIVITDNELETHRIIASVEDDAAGAIDVFIGTVRNKTSDKTVTRLEYESYDTMAIREIQKIVDTAITKWPIKKVTVHHRKGILKIGDAAVVIAVSTPHRKESFEACQFIIDNLKKTVPIWKKEVFDDGEIWASSHP
ncbi:MAG: molybdenum cofactor biosynthesis protein MoaE [Bacteroidetes bacterium]|nr:molybdenum cofactor biosynthesis protein MoaE [Bacteroidota bacterium]MDA1121925.1 molybdenum cofactor biosynthesis protein MoaE [Bacteroidota bacterium]